MNTTRICRLAAALACVAAAASATDLQIQCPEGAGIRLDGADAGVCREAEEGRYLSDLPPGEHVVEVVLPGGEVQRHEVVLDDAVPSRLDARDKQEKPAGRLYLQCIPQECTVRVAGTDLEIDQDDLRLTEVPAGRYVLQFRRGKKTLETVAFVKDGKPTGVRADFLAGRAGIVSAGEIPRPDDTGWDFAQSLESTVLQKNLRDQLDSEIRRMEALRKGKPAEKPEDVPPPQ
ncbi:MAG TPA: carboxypeptidase-like regulatory domain-containing protein [Thermoanaerobaculia bacterium]|nr:carboxypeptidase-like regulatory domain-containing protein [Thermoanaerobaculia bacterium]